MDCGFLCALTARELSLEQIGRWAVSYYASTKNGHLAIANILAFSPEDAGLRAELAENLYEEETGLISGAGRCHMDLFIDFLNALGVSAEEAAAVPGLATAAYAHPIVADEYFAQIRHRTTRRSGTVAAPGADHRWSDQRAFASSNRRRVRSRSRGRSSKVCGSHSDRSTEKKSPP